MKGYRLDCSSCSPLNGARVFRHGKQYGFNITGSYDNPKINKIYNAQTSITSDMLQRIFSNYY